MTASGGHCASEGKIAGMPDMEVETVGKAHALVDDGIGDAVETPAHRLGHPGHR
ncbi:MAG: hypothetical protein OXE85_04340 [Roseovarius sp.]|nr:hypothetical protein [Roseovarius sp.]